MVENNSFEFCCAPADVLTSYHHGILAHPMVANQKWEAPQSPSTHPDASSDQYMFIMDIDIRLDGIDILYIEYYAG